MKYHVLEPFKVKTSKGEIVLQAEQFISLPSDKALMLIAQGKISPTLEVNKAYEEAERQAWCRTACILSFPSQWRICERFKPKPCPKLQINFHVR